MNILVLIAVAVAGIGITLNAFSNPKTKLFRRVWSTERLGGTHAQEEQGKAIISLFRRYNISSDQTESAICEAVTSLLADAASFDLRNPNNLGVRVAPVIARELNYRIPNLSAALENVASSKA